MVEEQFGSDFLDWCITAVFYSALHYMSAFIAHSKKKIPTRHRQTRALLDPEGENTLSMEYIPYEAYNELYEYAHKTRYLKHHNGIASAAIIEKDFKECKTNLGIIKEFVGKHGIR